MVIIHFNVFHWASILNKPKICFRIYQLLILLLTPVLILVLFIRSFSQKEYRQRMSERLGWIPSKLKSNGIIVHAASVGEVIAIKPFIDQLLVDDPKQVITITTFTPTGSAQVRKQFSDKVQHCYLPLDISFCVHLFLKTLKPKVLVLMETELWPTLIHRCSKSDVKLLLINGRLSAKSLRNYQKIIRLIEPAINKIDAILCQSDDNAQHFKALGADPEKVSISGNLKYDMVVNDDVIEKVSELKMQNITDRRLLVVGSTHQQEEPLIVNAFKRLKQRHTDLLLVIVPRHPERFVSVGEYCIEQGFNIAKRSSNDSINSKTDIWLIDTLGELLAIYALAEVCVVAGSFCDVQGHNPLEPALFAKPILVGPKMGNFKEINQKLLTANAIHQLSTNEQLTENIDKLLQNRAESQDMGKAALDVVESNQGATQRSIEHLYQLTV